MGEYHSFSVDLAQEHGVFEALIVQHIAYIIKNHARDNNDKYYYQGKYWIRKPLEGFRKTYRYLSEPQIKRLLAKMCTTSKILEKGNFNKIYRNRPDDRTCWYTLNDDLYEELITKELQDEDGRKKGDICSPFKGKEAETKKTPDEKPGTNSSEEYRKPQTKSSVDMQKKAKPTDEFVLSLIVISINTSYINSSSYINEVQFEDKKKRYYFLNLTTNNPNLELEDKLKSYLSKKQIKYLLDNYPLEHIIDSLDLLEYLKRYNPRQIRNNNYSAYLYTTITGDCLYSRHIEEYKNQIRIFREKELEAERQKTIQDVKKEYYKNLSEEEKVEIEKRAKEYDTGISNIITPYISIKPSLYHYSLLKDKFTSSEITKMLYNAIKDNRQMEEVLHECGYGRNKIYNL